MTVSADRVVLLPRFSTFAGSDFRTLAINVMAYDEIDLYVWRGDMITGATFDFTLEASVDQEVWETLSTVSPSAGAEARIGSDLTKPWLRAFVELGATGSDFPVATCYAVGKLIRRRR